MSTAELKHKESNGVWDKPTRTEFPGICYFKAIARTLVGVKRGMKSPWIKVGFGGNMNDPRTINIIGGIILHSTYQRGNSLAQFVRDDYDEKFPTVLTLHWPCTPLVMSVFHDIPIIPQFDPVDPKGSPVTYAPRIPWHLIGEFPTQDEWDTLLVYCLMGTPNTWHQKMLLFQRSANLFDLILDMNRAPDSMLSSALPDIRAILPIYQACGKSQQFFEKILADNLAFLVDWTRTRIPGHRLLDLTPLIFLPTTQLVRIVSPLVDWANLTRPTITVNDLNSAVTDVVEFIISILDSQVDESKSRQPEPDTKMADDEHQDPSINSTFTAAANAATLRELLVCRDLSSKMIIDD